MPRKDRVAPVKGGRWTETEYKTLFIIFNDHNLDIATEQQKADVVRLWHAIHPNHRNNGRDYSFSLLFETYRWRHYAGKNKCWKVISRPNKFRGDTYSKNEKKEFVNLKAIITATMASLEIDFADSGRKAGDGSMCACGQCSGTAKPKPSGKASKASTTTRQSNKRSRRAKDADVSGAYTTGGNRDADSASSPAFSRPSRAAQRKRSYAELEEEDELEMDDNGEMEDGADGGDQEQDEEDAEAHHDDHHLNANATQYEGPADEKVGAFSDVVIDRHKEAVSEVGKRLAPLAIDRPAIAYGTAPPAPGPALKMVHSQDVVFSGGRIDFYPDMDNDRLRRTLDAGMYFKPDSRIFEFGGMLTALTLPSGKQNVMLCDTRKCRTCSKSANNNAVSATNGMPFVHRNQLTFDDAKTGILEFTPNDKAKYRPCEVGQASEVQKVMLMTKDGLRLYTCAVCTRSCTHCRMADVLDTRGRTTAKREAEYRGA